MVQGGSASGFPIGWDPVTGRGMPLKFFIPTSARQFGASATQPIVHQQNPPAAQPMAQNTSFPQMVGQVNASAAPLMTPQQHLALLVQPKTAIEFLISRSPHWGGVNWVFHDAMTGSVRHINMPYMHPATQ